MKYLIGHIMYYDIYYIHLIMKILLHVPINLIEVRAILKTKFPNLLLSFTNCICMCETEGTSVGKAIVVNVRERPEKYHFISHKVRIAILYITRL